MATRTAMAGAWFDEEGCATGIKRIDNYKKRWNKTIGHWADEHLHDANSHGADALRQWGQEVEKGNQFVPARKREFRRSGSAMAR